MLAVAGLLDLVAGRVDEAIARQERAVARETLNSSLLTDLAAFYISRSGSEAAHPDDLFRALTALDKALSSTPAMPEARFNRALVLEKLFLYKQASAEWRYSVLSSGLSGRGAEARAHLARLGVSAEEAWKVEELRLAKASFEGEIAIVHQVVTAFPQSAGLYARDVGA